MKSKRMAIIDVKKWFAELDRLRKGRTFRRGPDKGNFPFADILTDWLFR
jgi:hypothetical protein